MLFQYISVIVCRLYNSDTVRLAAILKPIILAEAYSATSIIE